MQSECSYPLQPLQLWGPCGAAEHQGAFHDDAPSATAAVPLPSCVGHSKQPQPAAQQLCVCDTTCSLLSAPQLFEVWLSIKSGRSRQWSSSARWARAHGLQEQRLYEMAKLKRQFAELLEDAGEGAAGCEGAAGRLRLRAVAASMTFRLQLHGL